MLKGVILILNLILNNPVMDKTLKNYVHVMVALSIKYGNIWYSNNG
jgi:hypothetical protein